jgi:1-acyl-sn-glycerol-3-phosphate acyltransferase
MINEICYLIFKISGWTFKSKLPDDLRSFVFIGAPHTSNFDFIPAMAINKLLKRNTRFVIKNDWLKFPFNLILRPAGAIGIDREKLKDKGSASTTDHIADLFHHFPELVLMISPEGTRSPNPTWKTGFYFIAQKAHVPIVLGYAYFKKKEAGIGEIIYPTNFEEDMTKIMNFYKGIQGKRPECFKLDQRYI